jgi:hypothetical protein
MGDFFSGAAESSADLELGAPRTDKKRPSTGNPDIAEGPQAKKPKVPAQETYETAQSKVSWFSRPILEFLC